MPFYVLEEKTNVVIFIVFECFVSFLEHCALVCVIFCCFLVFCYVFQFFCFVCEYFCFDCLSELLKF